MDSPLPLQRRLRRRLVQLRTQPWLVPLLLLLLYVAIMAGLSLVADGWIVAVAVTPLVFAVLLTLACLAAYRRDFYA